MIKSMTGFGRGEYSDGVHTFTVEIKTLNHRYNDIIIKLPKYISYVEENTKKLIKEYINRGRVEVYIALEYIDDGNTEVKVNTSLAKSYKIAFESIVNELELDEKITLEHLIKMPDIIKADRTEDDENEIWLCLQTALNEALNNVVEMRIREGEELVKDIRHRTVKIKELIDIIKERAPLVVEEYRIKLKERVEELLLEEYKLDDCKLENEVVFYADRSNITEEIVRFNSHIKQLNDCLDSEESVGRKLDFLIQELNREVNTIGSKSSDIEIGNTVVEIKSELEKIREQIQNIE
ncbi:YicC/YloC family endoribonuclease [Anaerosalibacter sp. Marseille-P3206]|uniref:YicC/YloC family endoribonuclease n=1 Tax=Anaerosalibacter sp. Marseille-P3206 TaxID=1871005 RepID=UPI0009866060|nr:YicC/YloC family endoribonuclease [Anaerosalibacter sp. Marseille-P3206]